MHVKKIVSIFTSVVVVRTTKKIVDHHFHLPLSSSPPHLFYFCCVNVWLSSQALEQHKVNVLCLMGSLHI